MTVGNEKNITETGIDARILEEIRQPAEKYKIHKVLLFPRATSQVGMLAGFENSL